MLPIFIIAFFFSCNDSQTINFDGLQGYYKYDIIDYRTGQPKDSLFSCLTISHFRHSDTLKIYNSILGVYLGEGNKFLYVWSVNEMDGKLVPKTFTFLNKSMPVHYTWSVEKEIGFSSGTFEKKFKILSNDTCLNIFSRKLDHVLLLEQRDWIDVGGMWEVQLFGFDKTDKLVFFHQYIDTDLGKDSTKQLHTGLHPDEKAIDFNNYFYHEIKDYLILVKFIKSDSISKIDCKNWETKNTPYARKWLVRTNKLADLIPPAKAIERAELSSKNTKILPQNQE